MINDPSGSENLLTFSSQAADLSQPLVLERDGQPLAVLMSIEAYERYQTLLAQQETLSAAAARRAADRAVFRDLVGCALSSGEPVWAAAPTPQWRVPYRFLDGTLLTIITVDAHTGAVSLTEETRTSLLEQVEQLAASANPAANDA